MEKIPTFPLFYPKRKIPTYQISSEREEMLENYQIFQSKKSNSYEKILFVARANTDKFPENDEYVKNEKAQYLKNLIQKHQAHLPWELQRNKFIFIKTKPKIPNKPLNPLKEDQETDGLQNTKKKVDKKDKKKEEKIDNLEILSDKPLEEKHEIVETSMEEDSSIHGEYEENGNEDFDEGSEGGENYD